MLNLKSSTVPWWADCLEDHLPAILLDHAHCEKKAASTAMNLIFAYVDRVPLIRALSPIVTEELDHFEQVIQHIESRGIRFRRLSPSSYGARLAALVRKLEPGRAIDRLLTAALIEARSCERFALLAERCRDKKLAEFYRSLFESEARHHGTYVKLAHHFADGTAVSARLEELSEREAEILARGDPQPRMHS